MNAAEDTSHNCHNLHSNITKTCEKTGQSELNNINYGEEKITGKLNIDVRQSGDNARKWSLFKNPERALVFAWGMSIVKMEETYGVKKQTGCANHNKSQLYMHICIDLIQHALPAIIMMTLW